MSDRPTTLKPLAAPRSLAEDAADRIREQILAGGYKQGEHLVEAKIADQPTDTFASDLATNIAGAQAAAKAAEKAMAEQRSGSLLLTGGGFALAPSPDYISLSIGKAGIRALAQGLFEDFKAKGIHVGTVTVTAWVSPGSDHATAVAEQFWKLHNEKPDAWTNEVQYS